MWVNHNKSKPLSIL